MFVRRGDTRLTSRKRILAVQSFGKHFGVLILMGVAGLYTGCAPQVGDACSSNLDCGAQVTCDLSQPGGYCTVQNCLSGSCPDESVCVEFDNGENWCMAMCDSTGDCRDDYQCLPGEGSHAFCTPTIEEDEE